MDTKNLDEKNTVIFSEFFPLPISGIRIASGAASQAQPTKGLLVQVKLSVRSDGRHQPGTQRPGSTTGGFSDRHVPCTAELLQEPSKKIQLK